MKIVLQPMQSKFVDNFITVFKIEITLEVVKKLSGLLLSFCHDICLINGTNNMCMCISTKYRLPSST